jgi:16S rRNA (cytidine1402-2'-O)-methyltransferase
MNNGKIYFIATPIGNLGDITERAKEVLALSDLVVCEDTRVGGKLLKYLNIKKQLVSLHQHSSNEKINQIIHETEIGKNISYLSDSGTPGVSDPGQKLARVARDLGVEIIPIPGPSALSAAISVSGMIEKEFYFAGFLPKKKGRETKLKAFSVFDCPIIIYESALRIERTLSDLKKHFGENCEVFIAREMTKKFEEYWGGDIKSIINSLSTHTVKGEFVLIVGKK